MPPPPSCDSKPSTPYPHRSRITDQPNRNRRRAEMCFRVAFSFLLLLPLLPAALNFVRFFVVIFCLLQGSHGKAVDFRDFGVEGRDGPRI